MTTSTYLKAAAKTIAAGIVGFLAAKGIEVDGAALELVITGLFVGGASIVMNLLLTALAKVPLISRLLPTYETKV